MDTKHVQKTLLQMLHRCTMPLVVALTVACVSWSAMEHVSALYILTGGEEDSPVVWKEGSQSQEISSRLVHLSGGQQGYDLTLSPSQSVTITHEGETVAANARASRDETVSDLLKRLHINPSPLEMVAVDLSGDKVALTVASELTYYEEITEDASFETYRVANPSLFEDEERVIQEGKDGVRTSIYEVTWSSGEELSRQFVEDVDSTVVDKIIEYGTAPRPVEPPEEPETPKADSPAKSTPKATNQAIAGVSKNADGSGILTLADGTTLEFSSVRSMTATAYTAGYDGAGYVTASGTPVRVGAVAVDRRVIPLGTRMYIVTADGSITYGMAVAEDTGVRGNIVDLYYDTNSQCIRFGRRACTVYILK